MEAAAADVDERAGGGKPCASRRTLTVW